MSAHAPAATSPILEICVDNTSSASAAAEGRADRIELCTNLPEGGTTPSAGLIRIVRAIFSRKMMVLIRPRGYDFLYSEPDMAAMVHDIRTARELGADGVVIGCLTREGTVDAAACRRLMTAAEGMEITFHRAFDMTRDLSEALEAVSALGIRRILTSGGRRQAPEATSELARLVRQAAGRLSIMAGGGLTESNVSELVRDTGVREVHMSARAPYRSLMVHRNNDCGMGAYSQDREYEWKQTSVEKVQRAKEALEGLSEKAAT